MYNCLILGCGRSGTSLTAGLLNKTDYFFGPDPIEPNRANPKGFFEDHVVNDVNERIMQQRFGKLRRPALLSRWLRRAPYRQGQFWLAVLDEPVEWIPDATVRSKIIELVSHGPYAYKDPRLSYTLNAWRPFLSRCKLICVFRHPGVVASSIVKEVSTAPYCRNLSVNLDEALQIWRAMYRQILDFHCTDDSEWLFIEYEQLIDGTALDAISKFLDAKVDNSFIDQRLNRSRPANIELGDEVGALYERLQQKARASQAAVLKPGVPG
jgi:hypothetical protein